MASKKASSASPVSLPMAADSAGEVSGPVATITLSHSGDGNPATSLRSMATRGCASSCRVTSSEKPSRSTASAPPAGSLWRSPAAMMSEPARRISSCSRPTALVAASSERKLLEQTSSASPPVLCASVRRCGRISWSTTGTPARATCQAASLPASPPPTMWMGAYGMRLPLRPDAANCNAEPEAGSRSRGAGVGPRGVQAALRKASGGTVAIMLGRAFMRPSQDSREVSLRIAAPSGVAAR